jgi:hypothetical protein
MTENEESISGESITVGHDWNYLERRFVTTRAVSMKRLAIGLCIRFLSVTIATGRT